jgi:hypothetical protein
MIYYSNFIKNIVCQRLFFTLMFLIARFSVVGQTISFTEASSKLPNYITFSSWLQKAVADVNGDGRDDIIRANNDGFFIEKQNADGTFTEQAIGLVGTSFIPLSVIVADLDNNGYADILTGGQYNGVYVFKANNDGSNYSLTRLEKDSVFTQASAIADVNNDGLLDLFVCNDTGTNALWRNTAGNFVADQLGFDFSTVPIDKRQGNYGIVFTDFNNDGKLDAYLSKCYAPEPVDSTVYQRINQLFVNNGQGALIDKAKTYNMADGRQTWVTEFQDIDNDGDLDAFIANHGGVGASRLMINDGTGYFSEITKAAGLGQMSDGILQALMRDFDNDGYVDIITAGLRSPIIYRNNGDLTFTEMPNLPIYNPSNDNINFLRSFAIGDLNHDGFLDIYASYRFNQDAPDRLWLNSGNTNNFLAITLVGTVSNRSAIGAKITVEVGGKKMIREVRAGESYGISNSLTQTFGLGKYTQIDRFTIRWPNGQVETKTINQINAFLSFAEPQCEIIAPSLRK